jgi:hypothetical protein
MCTARAEAFFLCERRRRRRIREVRAADLQEEMAEQRLSVPPDPTKTAASWRTSQRAERAIEHSALGEQLKKMVVLIAELDCGHRPRPARDAYASGIGAPGGFRFLQARIHIPAMIRPATSAVSA